MAKFGPLKIEKMDFWPNLDLSDLAKHGWGLPQYPPPIPNKPFLWTIHSIKKLLPAWCEGSIMKIEAVYVIHGRKTPRKE